MENLLLFKKTYELILWFYPLVMKFPKHQRFVLGQKILNSQISFIEMLIETNHSSNKAYLLKQAGLELEKIRFLVRLSKDLRFLSTGKYELFSEKNNEVGRLLGGMIKKFK